jgi:hypothetical protein
LFIEPLDLFHIRDDLVASRLEVVVIANFAVPTFAIL